MIHFRSPTPADCENLLANLRPADRAEIDKAGNITPQEMFAVAGNEDTFAVFTEGGDLICIYGVHPLPPQPHIGVVWLLGTRLLDSHLFCLCKRAPEVIRGWFEKYEILSNMTDRENRRIIMWLRWLGFSFTTSVEVRGHPFVQFVKVRPCVNP
jgi:hypothetical protein